MDLSSENGTFQRLVTHSGDEIACSGQNLITSFHWCNSGGVNFSGKLRQVEKSATACAVTYNNTTGVWWNVYISFLNCRDSPLKFTLIRVMSPSETNRILGTVYLSNMCTGKYSRQFKSTHGHTFIKAQMCIKCLKCLKNMYTDTVCILLKCVLLTIWYQNTRMLVGRKLEKK